MISNKEYLLQEKARIEFEFNELEQTYEAVIEKLKMLQGSHHQVCKMLNDLYSETEDELESGNQ